MFKEKLVIDIMKRNYSKIQCVAGDTLTLEVEFFNNSEPLTLSGYAITIEQGMDNNKFNIQTNNITTNKNILTCELSEAFTSKSGKHFIDISLFKGSERKTTFKIPFEVYSGAIEDSYEENEIVITILDELRDTILEATNVSKEVSQIVENSSNIKNELNQLNSSINGSLGELKTSINTANTTRNQLDSKVSEANSIKSELQSATNQSGPIKDSLNQVIAEAKSTNTRLDSTVREAETLDESLQDIINKANLGSLVTQDQFTPVKNKTDNIGGSGTTPTFSNYKFTSSAITKGSNSNASLGTDSERFTNVYAGSSANDEWGYTTLPNGLTVCWAKDYVETSSAGFMAKTAYFKNAFKNKVLNISLSLLCDFAGKENYDFLSVCDGKVTNENFIFRLNAKNSGWNQCWVYWFAIGF